MTCEWQEQIGAYTDGELEPQAQQAFAAHLQGCSACSAALLELQELKKAVRVAGRRFSVPPHLYADVRKQIHPQKSERRWLQWGMAAACLVLAATLTISWYSRTRENTPIVAQLVDQHVTMLASAHPVDVISEDTHTVKPWYQGKLPFTFNIPQLAKDSPFILLGGKLVYAQHSPGAELVFQVRQHKISVFIFQARDIKANASASERAFTVNSWKQRELQYFVVTDAAKEDGEQLRTLLEEANR